MIKNVILCVGISVIGISIIKEIRDNNILLENKIKLLEQY